MALMPVRQDANPEVFEMAKEDADRRRVVGRRKRAAHLAGAAIDDSADTSASAIDQAMRKRRLLEGPAEFRDVRVDRSTIEK
jgi:hypothetical protein